jgi:glycosyltransferase involved in cell wall biosynthesis
VSEAAGRETLRVAHVNDTAGVASALAAGLRARNVECTVLVQAISADHTYALLPKLLGIWTRIRSALLIRAQVRRLRADIAHVHYSMAALWFLGLQQPLIVHAHGTDVRPLIPSVWKSVINRVVCRRAALVLYSTPDLREPLRLLGVQARFLPNPLDPGPFAAVAARQPTRDVLLFMRLNRIKGAELAIAALRRLHRDHPDLTITVIGDGELVGRLDLTSFTVIAAVARERVADLIADHRVVVGQLKLGTVSLSELEAMACARPVVGRFDYAGAYPEPPPLVNVQGEEQLARTIADLLADEAERERLGRLGAEWVRRHHGLHDVITELLQHYRNVLSRSVQ